MNDLGPRLTEIAGGEAQRILQSAAAATRHTQREALWDRLQPSLCARSATPGSTTLVAVLVAGVFLGGIGVRVWPNSAPASSALALESIGQFSFDNDATYSLSPQGVDPKIVLQSGSVQADVQRQPSGHPFSVITPHARVVVLGTQFRVDALRTRTVVTVHRGRVSVHTSMASALVAEGESISSDDPRLAGLPIPPGSDAANSRQVDSSDEVPAAPVAQAPFGVTRRIDAPVPSDPDGLAAQTAMFALGQDLQRRDPSQALAQWQAYLHRFPAGVFADEALAHEIAALQAVGRHSLALEKADAFLRLQAASPQRAQVVLRRAALLCHLGRHTEALQVYESSTGLGGRIAEEVVFGTACCLLHSNKTAEGEAMLDRYLAEYPSGDHVRDILFYRSGGSATIKP